MMPRAQTYARIILRALHLPWPEGWLGDVGAGSPEASLAS